MNRFALVFTALLAVLAGCQPDYYHAQTTWHDDGSIDRAVLQPGGKMAPGVEEPENWDETFRIQHHDFDFHGDIRNIPEEVDGPYVAAWAKVADGRPLPDHYHRVGSDDSFESRLKQDVVRTDYGLLVEYVWEETLTEIVRLPDLRRAIVEVTTISGDAAATILGQALGEKYDTSGLDAWFTTDGREFLLDLFDVLYNAALRSKLADDESRVEIREVCSRHGLHVTLLDDWSKEDEVALQNFFLTVLRGTIQTADGNAADEPTLDALVGLLADTYAAQHAELKARIEQATEDYQQAWPGGKDAQKKIMENLSTRVLGVHGAILSSPQRFRFRMTLPGNVVETSGQLVDAKTVEWQFRASDAWPAGVVMTARSLQGQTKLFRDSLAPNFKPTQEKLLQLSATVGDDEPLRAALRACREQSSDAPLTEVEKGLPADDETRGRIAALRKLLKGGAR